MVAMHWGTFVLTDEPMDEPPRRAFAAWTAAPFPDDRLWVMAPGETRSRKP
jgi:N-acyl-phosphatidylethanolamine-hydrolysing phospholipase D